MITENGIGHEATAVTLRREKIRGRKLIEIHGNVGRKARVTKYFHRVLDGTGVDAFVSDIAIKDGKIARVAEGLSGAEKIIDATGLTVSPGWIDSHSHSDRTIENFPDQREKIEQGITFSIAGQCGGSVAPVLHSNGVLFHNARGGR